MSENKIVKVVLQPDSITAKPGEVFELSAMAFREGDDKPFRANARWTPGGGCYVSRDGILKVGESAGVFKVWCAVEGYDKEEFLLLTVVVGTMRNLEDPDGVKCSLKIADPEKTDNSISVVANDTDMVDASELARGKGITQVVKDLSKKREPSGHVNLEKIIEKSSELGQTTKKIMKENSGSLGIIFVILLAIAGIYSGYIAARQNGISDKAISLYSSIAAFSAVALWLLFRGCKSGTIPKAINTTQKYGRAAMRAGEGNPDIGWTLVYSAVTVCFGYSVGSGAENPYIFLGLFFGGIGLNIKLLYEQKGEIAKACIRRLYRKNPSKMFDLFKQQIKDAELEIDLLDASENDKAEFYCQRLKKIREKIILLSVSMAEKREIFEEEIRLYQKAIAELTDDTGKREYKQKLANAILPQAVLNAGNYLTTDERNN